MDGEDYSQKVWQPVTHYLEAEWAEGCQGTLSGAERDLLGTVSPLGHACLCAKAMPWPKREVIYINAFPTGVTRLSTEGTNSSVLEMLSNWAAWE